MEDNSEGLVNTVRIILPCRLLHWVIPTSSIISPGGNASSEKDIKIDVIQVRIWALEQYIGTYSHAHALAHISSCTRTRLGAYKHTHAGIHAPTHARAHACRHTRAHTRAHIHTPTYTYTHHAYKIYF